MPKRVEIFRKDLIKIRCYVNINMKSKHLLIKLKTKYNYYYSLSFGTFYISNVLMVKNQLINMT